MKHKRRSTDINFNVAAFVGFLILAAAAAIQVAGLAHYLQHP